MRIWFSTGVVILNWGPRDIRRKNPLFWSLIEIRGKIHTNYGEDPFFLVFNRFDIGTDNFIAVQGATGVESL